MRRFRIPGPQGAFGQSLPIDDGTLALRRMVPPVPLSIYLLTGQGSQMPATLPWAGAQRMAVLPPAAATPVAAAAQTPAKPPPITVLDNDTRMLAATAYGEGSTDDVFEEMAAIANVLVRQRIERRVYKSDAAFIQADKTFAFAAHDGNPRYARLMKASIDEINADAGMAAAVRAAQNARAEGPKDYSNGAYFWDGADIKTNYARHAKVLAGIHFTDPKHNIYAIKDKDVPDEAWWFDAQGKKTKLRGTWKYKYESTAAWGGTVFWKYNADFMRATGNKAHL